MWIATLLTCTSIAAWVFMRLYSARTWKSLASRINGARTVFLAPERWTRRQFRAEGNIRSSHVVVRTTDSPVRRRLHPNSGWLGKLRSLLPFGRRSRGLKVTVTPIDRDIPRGLVIARRVDRRPARGFSREEWRRLVSISGEARGVLTGAARAKLFSLIVDHDVTVHSGAVIWEGAAPLLSARGLAEFIQRMVGAGEPLGLSIGEMAIARVKDAEPTPFPRLETPDSVSRVPVAEILRASTARSELMAQLGISEAEAHLHARIPPRGPRLGINNSDQTVSRRPTKGRIKQLAHSGAFKPVPQRPARPPEK